MPTRGSVSLYETVAMLEAIKLVREPFTFLRDTFFPNAEFFPTEEVLVDIVKGGQKMAPFVAPRVNGSLDTRNGFKTNKLTTPRIAPKRVLTGDDLKKRQPGQNLHTTKTPQQIAAEILMKDLIELNQQITRTEEWFAAKVMMGQKFDIEVVDENGKKAGTINIDYGFKNKVAVGTSDKWTAKNAEGNHSVDPITSIETWIEEKIMPNSSATPNIVVMDPAAAKAFTNNTNVKDIIRLRAQAGTIQEPTYKGKGVTFIGVFTKFNVEVYAYSCLVEAKEGSVQLLQSGTVIVGESGQGTAAYGAVLQKENGEWVEYMEKRVPKYSVDDDKEIDTERLTSRPLFYQKDIDSFVVATGVC